VDGKQDNPTEKLTENPQSEFSANPNQDKNNFKGSKKSGTEKFEICPECHSSSLIFQEGCYICMSCGYTKCS
jgi:ribonucleoside-diphosphate reductase alpha chain